MKVEFKMMLCIIYVLLFIKYSTASIVINNEFNIYHQERNRQWNTLEKLIEKKDVRVSLKHECTSHDCSNLKMTVTLDLEIYFGIISNLFRFSDSFTITLYMIRQNIIKQKKFMTPESTLFGTADECLYQHVNPW